MPDDNTPASDLERDRAFRDFNLVLRGAYAAKNPATRRRQQKRRQQLAALTIHEIWQDIELLLRVTRKYAEGELPIELRTKLDEACRDFLEQYRMLAHNDQQPIRDHADRARRLMGDAP